MKEKDVQDMMIGLLRKLGAHAVNMEPSATNPGIPDINWCLGGVEGNLEIKFGYEDGAAPMVRPAQIVWFRERVRAGGYPMFLYYIELEKFMDEVYVFQGRHYESLARAKDMEEIFDLPCLRIIHPNESVQGIMSEMASWHDELHPQIALV